MKYDFARKLKTASPNPRLCITFALTTANDKSFSKECTHGRSDGTVGEMPADFSAVAGGQPKMSQLRQAWDRFFFSRGGLEREI